MYPEKELEQLSRGILKDKMQRITSKSLSKMSDSDLAFWQSGFEHQDPRYRMAEHEWQRRLIAAQVNSSRFAALLGVIGTLIGAVVGSTLTFYLSAYLATG